MVTVTTTVERRSGVNYVVAQVDNRIDAPVVDAHTVEVSATVAPVWTPPEQGRPRWHDGTATVDVPAGVVAGIGFATPSKCPDEPVEVQSVQPAGEQENDQPTEPKTILRALGDPRPPRNAVPIPTMSETESGDRDHEANSSDCGSTANCRTDTTRQHAGNYTQPRNTHEQRASDTTQPVARQAASSTGDPSSTPPGTDTTRAPAPVERWLARVDRRVDQGSQTATAADRVHLQRVGREVERLLTRVSE